MSCNKHKGSGDVAGTIVFFEVLYCKIQNVYFLCLFFMYYLYEKHNTYYSTGLYSRLLVGYLG